jgi:glycosyltransferase involved in cell wall biosynthesis
MNFDNKAPLVSVRIPAYNHGKYVKQTLNSVLEQTYSNIEIVIIDDASTDNTWTEIQSWIKDNSNRISVVAKRHKENQGITKTLNELVALCKGQYIAGIASDDFLLPDSVSKRVEYLEKNQDKDAVFADCIVVDNENNLLFESGLSQLYSMDKTKLLDEKSRLNELIVNWGVPGGTLMVRNNVGNYLEFNERLLVEDFDFFLKLLARNKLGFIDERVSAYRRHDSNVSLNKKLSIRRKLDFLRTIFTSFSYFSLHGKLMLVKSSIRRLTRLW